jgi:translocation and assembly module TamB
VSTVSENQRTAKNRQKTSRLNRKIITGILKSILALMVVIGIFIGFLLTPWGSKVVVNTANQLVDELSIDYRSGSIGSQLHLSSLKWKQTARQIDIENLQLSLKLSCLWRLSLCFDSVISDSMAVQLNTIESSSGSEPITSPFPVFVEKIHLNNFSLKVLDSADITWQKLSGKLDFYQRLRVERMQLDGFKLNTYVPDEPPLNNKGDPFDWVTWQYQAITEQLVVLPLYFEMLSFQMSDVSLKLAAIEEIKLKKVSLKAKGSSKKVHLDELHVENEQGQLKAKGNVQLNGLFEHVLSIDANAQVLELPPLKLALRSSGNIDLFTTQIELAETSLSPKTITDANQLKSLKLAMEFTAQPSKANLPLNLLLNWSNLVWPLAEPTFNSKAGEMNIIGDLNALNMTIQTWLSGTNLPDSKISVNAIAASSSQNKSFQLNELLLETLGGQVLSKGELTFSEYTRWQGSTSIKHIDPGFFWPEFAANINGEVSTQADNSQGVWKANLDNLDIIGQWQGYPLTMSGMVDFQGDNGLQFNALSLTNADNHLLLDGNVSKQQTLDLKFELDAADLSNSIPQLSGMLNLSGILQGSVNHPEVSYELSGSDLMFAEVFVQQAVGKGSLQWNDDKPIDLSLQLKGLQGINNQLDSAQFVLKGDANKHLLDLTTSGPHTSVNLSVQGQLNHSSWQGDWLTGEVISTYANLTLIEPFKIDADWEKQQYQIAPHCWVHSENELCIKLAEFKQNTLAWDVSLKEFDLLSVASRLMPDIPKIQTKSRLDLDMSGDWNIKQLPNANLSASLSSADWVFTHQNNLKLSFEETKVNAQITPKSIVANIHLSGNKIGILSANVEGKSGVFADPLTRPIQGELLIERFDLAALKALMPGLDVLQGDINGQALIEGTLGKPLLIGELNLAKGALKDESLPVALSEIDQSIKLKGQSADFKGSYRLGKGLGQMDGDIAWTPTLKGNLNILGEELEFDYQSMIKANVSPNLNIMFEPNNLEVKGEVTIPYARVKVRELPKDTISPSKDVILVEKQAELEASEQRLALNVLLKVDPLRNDNVKLDAFGLTTDLRGELRLQNNKADIFGSGEVQLVNGRYRAYGQNLVIREGDILFTNSLDRPFLNVEAVRDPNLTADGVIAGLRIEGVAQNPSISVFSEPVMEQQQILSYMLTGRGMGESSGDSQDTILANALLSLGLGQSENLISKVGNKLGFEDVILDTSGQGEATQLSLTGTIAPGVQLRYGVGVFDSISEVAIRYELIPQLYIEAISGVSNAIDIYYQFSVEGSQNRKVKDD